MDFQHNDTLVHITFEDGDHKTFGDADTASVVGTQVKDGVFIVGVLDTEDRNPRVLSYGYPLSSVSSWLIDEEPVVQEEPKKGPKS